MVRIKNPVVAHVWGGKEESKEVRGDKKKRGNRGVKRIKENVYWLSPGIERTARADNSVDKHLKMVYLISFRTQCANSYLRFHSHLY